MAEACIGLIDNNESTEMLDVGAGRRTLYKCGVIFLYGVRLLGLFTSNSVVMTFPILSFRNWNQCAYCACIPMRIAHNNPPHYLYIQFQAGKYLT